MKPQPHRYRQVRRLHVNANHWDDTKWRPVSYSRNSNIAALFVTNSAPVTVAATGVYALLSPWFSVRNQRHVELLLGGAVACIICQPTN